MESNMDSQKYWAFISYSSKDSRIALRLHRALESYRIPRSLVGRPGRDAPIPRRLFPIFRDRDELPLSADLGSSIEDALRASRYLIVVCSPHAAKSRWVNEEVRYFKSIGREDHILAIIIDGEPNASDSAETAASECFPPALRHRVGTDGQITADRVEPIAGDLRRDGDGWTAAFLKAVAGITGLGYDAFAKRQRKRMFRRRVLQTVLVCLLIVAGLFYWDYSRLKVRYYAHVTTRWGVPEGVIPLTDDVRAHREISYRFESRGYKVRALLRVNSVGSLRDDPENHNASRTEVVYREDGSPLRLDLFDHNGHLVVREGYSPLEMRDSQGKIARTVRFENNHEFSQTLDARFGSLSTWTIPNPSQLPKQSAIAALRITYDSFGYDWKVAYCNAGGTPIRNADGAFGQQYEHDEYGLVTRTTNLGRDGKPLPDRYGVATTVSTLDKSGNCIRWLYLGSNDLPIQGPKLFATTDSVYDDCGNVIKSAYFGVDGPPTLSKDGYAKFTQTYDNRGNVIQWECFGVDGKPTLNNDGYAKFTLTYDNKGNATVGSYFGIAGEPALSHESIAAFKNRYDDRGNMVEQTFFGLDGKPTLFHEGYAKFTKTYDALGNVTEVAYFGLDGKPTRHKDGNASFTQAYDDRGNCTAVAYFGVDGKPTLNFEGISAFNNRYDELGNLVEQVFLGVDGEPALHRDGYAGFTRSQDDRGNMVEETFLGVNGKPTLHKDGYSKVTWTYDERGNDIKEACFDADGKPKLNKNGLREFHADL
jgi:hypothetical protein